MVRLDRVRGLRVKRSLLIGALTTAAGQLLLILVAPLTRASGTFVTRAGPAFLAPDSHWYLERSLPGASLGDIGWTTWGYVLVLRVGHYLGDAALFGVVVQVLLAVAAAAALFDLLARRHGPLAGVLGAMALTVNPMTAQWVRFVLTEGTFQPLVVLVVVTACRILEDDGPHRSWDVTLLIALSGVIAITRPNGFLVALSAAVLLALMLGSRRKRVLVLTATALLTPLLLLAALSATGQPGEAPLADQWYRGVVLEGTDEVRRTISMPAPVDASNTSEATLARYAVGHPVATLRLVATRIAVEVAQVRPHYPRVANLAVGAGILLYLGAATVGATAHGVGRVRRVALVVAVPHLLLVGITFATPEARYGWSGLVALSPLVGIGAQRIVALLSPPLRHARTPPGSSSRRSG